MFNTGLFATLVYSLILLNPLVSIPAEELSDFIVLNVSLAKSMVLLH